MVVSGRADDDETLSESMEDGGGVCMCVCVREKEREKVTFLGKKNQNIPIASLRGRTFQ